MGKQGVINTQSSSCTVKGCIYVNVHAESVPCRHATILVHTRVCSLCINRRTDEHVIMKARLCTYVPCYSLSYLHVCMDAGINTELHACTLSIAATALRRDMVCITHVRTYILTCFDAYILTYLHTYGNVRVYRTYMHACTHAGIHHALAYIPLVDTCMIELDLEEHRRILLYEAMRLIIARAYTCIPHSQTLCRRPKLQHPAA